MALSREELTDVLHPGERVVGCVSADGVFAANRDIFPNDPHVLLTDQRVAFLSRKGMFKKRTAEDASWSHADLTSRMNLSEGSALGPFMYLLTLFTHDGETVTAGFKDERDREAYKALVQQALGG